MATEVGLPVLKLLARNTANKELLLKTTWDLYINLSEISQIEMQGKEELFELNSDICNMAVYSIS